MTEGEYSVADLLEASKKSSHSIGGVPKSVPLVVLYLGVLIMFGLGTYLSLESLS